MPIKSIADADQTVNDCVSKIQLFVVFFSKLPNFREVCN